MLIQLNPPLPLTVVGGKGWKGPTGKGMAIMLQKWHPDHHHVWTIIMDETGQIWEVENPFVRGDRNTTWGRHSPDQIIQT